MPMTTLRLQNAQNISNEKPAAPTGHTIGHSGHGVRAFLIRDSIPAMAPSRPGPSRARKLISHDVA